MPDSRLRAQLDAAARQKGFKNYEQYAAWERNTRQVVLSGNAAVPQQQNWLQQLIARAPGHPAQTLGYVRRKMDEYLK